MRHDTIPISPRDYRRRDTTPRKRSLVALATSHDASRYPAKDMPRPTYDLDRKDGTTPWLTIFVLMLALVATGAGIVLIQQIGT